MNRWRWPSITAIGLLIVLLLGVVPQVSAQKANVGELELKAVFIFNFSKFVEWPESAFVGHDATFVIGILGVDPFGHILDDVVRGEVVRGRPLVVERFHSVDDIKTCHILFVSELETSDYAPIFAAVRGRPILTVGEGDGFATHGGTVRFMSAQNRIRLRVNLAAAEAAHLTISSQLLRAVEIVGADRRR